MNPQQADSILWLIRMVLAGINGVVAGWALFVVAWTEMIDPRSPDSIDFKLTHPARETVCWIVLFVMNGLAIGLPR